MCIAIQWKIHYWPSLCFILFTFTFIVSYLLAVVVTHHVYPLYPYVSDTASIPPESCIFGELFNLGSFATFITLYIRYKQIDIGILSGNIKVQRRWNKVSLWAVVIMSFGMTIVANVQQTGIEALHHLGAFLSIGVGVQYFILQTALSLACFKAKDPRYKISRGLLCSRVWLAVVIIVSFLICVICGIISKLHFKGRLVYYWTEKDGAFSARLASTFSEWIVLISMLIYILTFTKEFRNIRFGGIKFINNVEEPLNSKEILEVL